jgi:hypothetical protein
VPNLIWVDTSVAGAANLKIWNGTAWVLQGNLLANNLGNNLQATLPEGLTLGNNATNPTYAIDIQPGYALLTQTATYRRVTRLSSVMTKRLDQAWVAGTGNGGNIVGTVSNGTWHTFLVQNDTTGVVDVMFDSSAIGANIPTGWSFRRIGSFLRAAGSITPFKQFGDVFQYNTYIVDMAGVAVPTTQTLYTVSVPSGITVEYRGIFEPGLDVSGGSGQAITVYTPGTSPITPGGIPYASNFRGTVGSYYPGSWGFSTISPVTLATNSSAQIGMIRAGGYFGSSCYSVLQTIGWRDFLLYSGV